MADSAPTRSATKATGRLPQRRSGAGRPPPPSADELPVKEGSGEEEMHRPFLLIVECLIVANKVSGRRSRRRRWPPLRLEPASPSSSWRWQAVPAQHRCSVLSQGYEEWSGLRETEIDGGAVARSPGRSSPTPPS